MQIDGNYLGEPTMKRPTRKAFVLGYLPCLGIATLGIALTAHALPANEVTTTYYSDRSKAEAVGEITLYCTGQRSQWGRRTPYATQTSDPCDQGSPLPPPLGPFPCEFLASGCRSLPQLK
jgi:hypothetical protein